MDEGEYMLNIRPELTINIANLEARGLKIQVADSESLEWVEIGEYSANFVEEDAIIVVTFMGPNFSNYLRVQYADQNNDKWTYFIND